MVDKVSLRVVDYKWNHRDPTVGSSEISPGKYELSSTFTATAGHRYTCRLTTYQSALNQLGQHVQLFGTEKKTNDKGNRHCCWEEKKERKKKKKKKKKLIVG